MRDNRVPSEDILNGVRHITAWDHWFSAKVGKDLGEEGQRSYLGDKLRSIMSELEIEVSHREARGIFGGKYKLTYVVAHRGAIQLEFTDLLRDNTDLRTLESVRTYHPGEWAQKVNAAYQQCLVLSNQWNSVSRLIDQLASASHTPEEVAGLIEATGDTKETIRLLALSADWESTFGALSLSYCALGKCKEAEFVAETFISIYPENAGLHLALGNLFLGALINSNPPPGDSILRQTIETTENAGAEFLESLERSDPSLYETLTDRDYEQRGNEIRETLSQVTLKALGCSHEYACKKAAEEFRKAMQLSRNAGTTRQAQLAMASLEANRTMNKE